MLYNTDTIKKSLNNKNILIEDESIIDEGLSLFSEALYLITEDNRVYISIVNEDVKGTIKDWFNKSSKSFFCNIIKKIFGGLRNIVEKIWGLFKSFMTSMQGRAHVINKYKDILRNYNDSIEYPYEYIEFINLSNDTSDTLFNASIITLQGELESNLNSILKNGKYETIYNNLSKYNESLSSVEEYLSSMRSKFLGLYKEVSKEEFGNELYKYFRKEKGEGMTIYSNEIRESYNNYFVEYSKVMKDLDNKKSMIKRESAKAENKLLDIKINSYIETEITQDLSNQFNKVIMDSVNKIKGLCDMYTQYYSAKLDALKDQKIQDENILVGAVRKYIENKENKK